MSRKDEPLCLNIAEIPREVPVRRDALESARVNCTVRATEVEGSLCLSCPRLVFWMVGPHHDCLHLFCRKKGGEP